MVRDTFCRCNKVYHFDVAVGCEEYVFELEVPVNETVFV